MAPHGGPTLRFGERDVRRIGLGTNRLTDSDSTRAFLEEAVEAGIEMIDTAHLYTGGASETTIGNALAPYPDGVLVATKGGYGNGSGASTEDVRTELELSFDRLQTDSIDLYYVHRLHPDVPIGETLQLLAEYLDDGRIQHIGLSEVSVEQIDQARQTVPIAAVQNEFSLAERKHDEVVDHCEAEGIAFVPFFPLRSADTDAVEEVAQRTGATSNQVILAWLLHRSPVMLPIPGTLSLDHAKENLAALDLQLSDEDLQRLSA